VRVLLASTAEKGHLNPMVGVAQWLLEAGHHVGWLTVPEPAAQLSALDVEVVPLDGAPPPPPLVTGGQALARLVRDPAALRDWIRTLLIDAVPGQVEPMRRAVHGFGPDVLAVDGMLYQAVIAAHLERLPWVGVSSALTLLEPALPGWALLDDVGALRADRAALFARYGLEPEFRTCECLSPLLNVVFATADLVGDDARVPPHTRLVGPSRPRAHRGDEPGFPWEALDADRPLVYVSFGSQISWQPEVFRVIAEGAEGLEVQLVIVAGELASEGLAGRLSGDVIVVPYAPQLALLRRARACVSHGGANSVLESLDAGVPLLLLPVCNDQPVQAHFVSRAGAGLSLDPTALTPDGARAALARLLQPGPEREAAARIASAWSKLDGAREAARLIAALSSAG
jgi:MGT family glycosyltransferase